MKIAVFHNLPSGGAKRALYGFAKYLTKSGHLVDVFIPSTADETFLPLKDVANKVYVFPVRKTITGLIYSTFRYIPPINMKISLRDLERTEKEIADVINKKDYDIVFSEQDQNTMSPFFLKFIKKPAVYYCQQPSRFHEAILRNISQNRKQGDYPQLLRKIWHKYFVSRLPEIDRENASFSRYILTNSYFSRESILRSYGLNSFVSYLGVDTDIFKHLEIPKVNFVLSVGSCGPSKGFDFIIKSLARIDSKIRPRFIIVSNSVDVGWKNYLEQLAIKVGIELEIKHLVSNNELVQLYNKAKLVLYAPYLEPFGLVPLEAMACGTPVVAVREGGVRESVIHDETGILTERDEDMFAQAVSELLLNKEKREKMAKRCIEVIRNFWTLEHAGERLLNHLNRVMGVKI
ncbi:MAG: glycosyltransferase family 4 protein [Firmicutes bacterium]|nr:glycosyltransferase family 4 protein [Bacillota bacterium]